MNIGIGGIYHETNTFSKRWTVKENFQRNYYSSNDLIAGLKDSKTSIGGFIDSAKFYHDDLIAVLYTAATPSGTISKITFDRLVEDFFQSTDKWERMDSFLLAQHGAMSVEGYDDAEGYFIEKVRSKLRNKPLVITVDYHANLSEKMINNCSCIVGYDTYPHIDIYERALDAYKVLKKINSAKGDPIISTALLKLPILGIPQAISTEDGLFKEAMDKVHFYEEDDDIANITLCGGYAYADRKNTGICISVSYWKNTKKAKKITADIGRYIWENRKKIKVHNTDVDEALLQASESDRFPLILVDVSDNVGGGAPGDGTVILKGLIDKKMRDAVVFIADSKAVSKCINKGVGQKITLKIGGKTDKMHGKPVSISGYIKMVTDGNFLNIGKNMTGMKTRMGSSVLLISEGIKIVLTEYATPPFDPGMFSEMGIDPRNEKYIIVKGAIAWKTGIDLEPAKIIYVDTPGICSADLSHFDYKRVGRPIYPLDNFDFDIESNIKVFNNNNGSKNGYKRN